MIKSTVHLIAEQPQQSTVHLIAEQPQQSTRYLLHVSAPHGPLSRSINYKKLQKYTITYQKTNYGLINIKYNWGGRDPNTGRSAIRERQR